MYFYNYHLLQSGETWEQAHHCLHPHFTVPHEAAAGFQRDVSHDLQCTDFQPDISHDLHGNDFQPEISHDLHGNDFMPQFRIGIN